MQNHLLSLTPVVLRSPFDAVDDGSPSSLVSQTRGTALFDPGDEAVRRFSDPAPNTKRQQLAAHITRARTAYAKAFLSMQKSAKDAKVDAQLESSTEKDVAEMAMDIYANAPAADGWDVSRFVNILHHYHGVFDVLCQSDFSYLTLIWGGLKLILIMAKNRGDLLEKVMDSLFEIGWSLSRIEIYTKLFPTTRMIELTSRLYAAIVEFLQDVIAHFQRHPVRQMISTLVRPFEEKFGRVMGRIHRLETCIQQDAALMQALQTASIAHHRVDSLLQRHHVEVALNGIPAGHVPDMFLRIKDILFQGLEHQANYHEDLASMYTVTAGAWKAWFAEEQRYLPSDLAPTARLTQGLCDAPDSQHALQWAARQLARSPHIPSAYLIWAKGMTAQSAIASLIFQILTQRRTVVSEHNLDMQMFKRAGASIKALWDMFVHLMRVLGGCLIYISMGSAGPDEAAVVEKFVKTVQRWDGPPISVTIIHPANDWFTYVDDVTDIDGIYDVHPSLTTTDALHHVLMLELDMHSVVSETIRTVLWESLWREVRYAVIGVALAGVTEKVRLAAEELGRERVEEQELTGDGLELWLKGVQRWIDNRVASNDVREQIQRHLGILVELGLPTDLRASLAQRLKLVVFRADTDHIGSRPLTQPQRDRVWDRIQAAIDPGTVAMFCGAVRGLVEEALDDYCELPSRNPRQAGAAVVRMLDARFGREGCWKESFSEDKRLIVDGIDEGIVIGFGDVIEALSEPEEKEGEEKKEAGTEGGGRVGGGKEKGGT